MAYGTTLDSLNQAVLNEQAQRASEANSFRNYLLGLASERNRGRQVDVNAMDAGTRREGLGVQERLGNRQWDTEGRRVDVMGRDVDARERVGMGQIGVQRDDISSRERVAGRQADINQKIADTDATYKGALASDMERARRNQELGITTQADIGIIDAYTRARQVSNQYDVQIRQLQQNGDIEGARIKQAEKALAVQRELGIGALANDTTRAGAAKLLAEAQADVVRNPIPSEGMRLDVASRNEAAMDAYSKAPIVASVLNNKFDSSFGVFDWNGDPNVVNELLLDPRVAPSLRYLKQDPATKRFSVDPSVRPELIDLSRRPRASTQPQPQTQPQPEDQAGIGLPPYTWGDAFANARPTELPSVNPYLLPPSGQPTELPDIPIPPMPPPRSGDRFPREPDPSVSPWMFNPFSAVGEMARSVAGGVGSAVSPRTAPTQPTPEPPGRKIPKIVFRPDGTTAVE